MKQLSVMFLAALMAIAAPLQQARAEVDVSIDFFYDSLSPHGDWIYADNYGYVFQPTLAMNDPNWAPYTDGYWAYTDAGWTWMSEEDFGWATYHYGRWVRMFDSWVWVPGNEWAPAWVSWRQTDDHVGWAPLPPEARWSASVGFNNWTDSYYDIGPMFYNFVPFNLFARRTSLRPVIIDRGRNITYVRRSVNITNISYRQNVVNNIFVGGPDPDRFDRGDNRIRRLSLRRDDERFRRDWLDRRDDDRRRDPRSFSRVERDTLLVAAPSIRRDDTPMIPGRVRERFERPEVDRGWRGVRDEKALADLRENHRAELAKARPEALPEKAPAIVTSRVPPPAVGRELKPDERRVAGRRPGPGQVEEGVRPASPSPADRDRPGMSGRPDSRDAPPGREEVRRPGSTGREVAPGMRPDGRPGSGPDGRPDSRPDRGPEGRMDANQPRRPDMARPGEGPNTRVSPGMNEDRRRPGGMPSSPDRPRTENAPPAPKEDADRKGADRNGPASRPDTPSMNPNTPRLRPESPSARREGPPSAKSDSPGSPRVDRAPEARRPTPPSPSKAKPMPEARKELPKARPSPMPKPEAKGRTAPMPSPQKRPSPPKAKDDDRRKSTTASLGVARPSSAPTARKTAPEVKKAAPKPAPQVRKSPPKPAPQVKKAPSKPQSQVRKAPSKPAPQVKKPASRPKPQVKKAPSRKSSDSEKRKRD